MDGLVRIHIVESFVFESTYAPAAAAARGFDAARAAAYARWTLTLDEARAPGPALCAGDKLLRRGALVPAPPRLEAALSRLLGERLQAGLRAAHRIQAAALWFGPRGGTATDLSDAGDFTRAEAAAVLALALDDLAALERATQALYPEEAPPAQALFFSFCGSGKPGWACARLDDGGEGPAAPFLACEPRPALARPRALEALLARAFGRSAFRPGQAEVLAAALAGRDAAALLPTGGGKSLIPQLAALLRPGVGLIVEPLLSVVDDQLAGLRRAGVGAAAAAAEPGALERLAAGRLLLVYASPERLRNAAFRRALSLEAGRAGAAFVAVDEAHCVTDWGHDFRPALLSLGRRARRWAAGPFGEPPVLALTGTASQAQLTRACAALGLRRPFAAARPLGRGELRFSVERCGPRDRPARLRAWIRRSPGARFSSGLVFCPTVEGAAAARRALEDERLSAGLFTGRAPAGEDAAGWPAKKAAAARAFLSRRLDWLCCTSAFGLGVDVPGARYVAHAGLPSSLESYFQEAGRAGRDGRAAECRVFLWIADERRARRWLAEGAPLETLRLEHAAVPPGGRDDAWAALKLHLGGWPGLAAERAGARAALAALGPPRAGRLATLRFSGQSPEAAARALARLEQAGLIEVWTRSRLGLAALWLREEPPERALAAAEAAAAAAYADAEPARRASLGRLVACCLSADPGRALEDASRAMGAPASGADEAAVQGLVLEDGAVPG